MAELLDDGREQLDLRLAASMTLDDIEFGQDSGNDRLTAQVLRS